MCLIFIAKQSHPDYPFILAANRDEFFERPANRAAFWSKTDLLAGKDLMAGGTWLGLNHAGDLATVTNVREPGMDQKPDHALSRGNIPLFMLKNTDTFSEQLRLLEKDYPRYTGFNLLAGNIQSDIHHRSNRSNKQLTITKGVHGLSNAGLDSNWPKVQQGIKAIETLNNKPFAIEDWFDLLANKQTYPDSQLPETGIDLELERLLSASFIHSETYGTRTSTVITLDHCNNVTFHERNFDSSGRISGTQCFRWNLDAVN